MIVFIPFSYKKITYHEKAEYEQEERNYEKKLVLDAVQKCDGAAESSNPRQSSVKKQHHSGPEKRYPGKGEEYASKLRDYTIALYKKCAEYALSKGIIIADTKFEFGLDEEGNIVVGDEMLTPDSSRFWPADGYESGHSQPSFDKQFARDWLKANPDNDWTLPQDIVEKTIAKYLQGYELLTGRPLA